MAKVKKTEIEVTAPVEEKETVVVSANEGDSLTDAAKEREEIYDRYLKKEEQELQPTGEEIPEKKEEELKTAAEEPKTEQPVKKEDYVKTDVLTETPKAEEETQKEKLVPYDALHEEREKRKSAQKRARELEALLEQALREKEAQKTTVTLPPDGEADYIDPAVPKIREELNYLKQTILAREKQKEQWDAEQRATNLQNLIKDTDSVLEKEGYPAFGFMVNSVQQRLQYLVNEDPDNVYLDTPEGWKKIYKEQIFPQIKSKVATSLQRQIISEKEALKAKAQLSSSGGRMGGDKKTDGSDNWTYDDYLSDRKKAQLY